MLGFCKDPEPQVLSTDRSSTLPLPTPSQPRCPRATESLLASWTRRPWAGPPGNPADSLRAGGILASHGTDPRRDEQAWPRAALPGHPGLSVGAPAGPLVHAPGCPRRGGMVATAEVPGAPGAAAVLTRPLLQVLRPTTTLPAARPRRSWRPPAAAPTSPRCPRRPVRPRESLLSCRAAAGGGRAPHVAVPLLNLLERCLASPPLPQKLPFGGPRSCRRGPREEKASHCQIDEARGGGPRGDQGGQPGAPRGRAAARPGPQDPPGPHRCPDGRPGHRFGPLAAPPHWGSLPCEAPGLLPLPVRPGAGGAPGEPAPRPRAAEFQGRAGHLAKGGLVGTRCQGPNSPASLPVPGDS